MEDKRCGGIQHAPFSLDLAPFDFAPFPQKSDLHGKRYTDLDELCIESDLKQVAQRATIVHLRALGSRYYACP